MAAGTYKKGQIVTIAAGSNVSAQLRIGSTYTLIANIDCWVEQGPTGVAAAVGVAPSFFLGKGVPIDIFVADADSERIAVIQISAGGFLCIMEDEAG